MIVHTHDSECFGDLGRIGEALAVQLLERNRFTSICRLGPNHPYADLLAERGGERFAISVKARNKWERPIAPSTIPVLNKRYKLGNAKNCLEFALQAEKKYNATAAWLTIAFERKTYDAYFSTLRMLQELEARGRKLNGKGVIMTAEYTPHYERLAHRDPHDYEYLGNLPEGVEPLAV